MPVATTACFRTFPIARKVYPWIARAGDGPDGAPALLSSVGAR